MEPEPRRPLLIRADAAYADAVAHPRRGLRAARSLAGEARAAGDAEALSKALRAGGWAARELYDHEGARRLLDEAVDSARSAGLDDVLAEALVARSAVHLEVGRDRLARRDLASARRAARDGSRAEVAFAEGLLEDEVGDYAAAVRAYRHALGLIGDDRPHLRVKTLNNLALTALRLGRHDAAEQWLAEAATLAATFSPAVSAFVAHSQAIVFAETGRPVEALRRFDHAERLLRAADLPLVELHMYRAVAFLALRLLDEAAVAAARAVQEYGEHEGGSFMLAEALVLQSRIALTQDRPKAAGAAAVRAEKLLRRQRRSGWRAVAAFLSVQAAVAQGQLSTGVMDRLARLERTMLRLRDVPFAVDAALLHGQVSAALGHPRRACNAFARAAATARGGHVLLRLRGRTAAALKSELEGDDRRLARLCRAGLVELADYRATFASTELRAKAAAHGRSLADLGLRAAVRSGRAERVWEWLEQAQSTIFLRTEVARNVPSAGEGGPADVAPMLVELRALVSDLTGLAPDEVASRTGLLRRVTALEHDIRRRSWTADGGGSWTLPSLGALRALRSELNGRTLLQYGLLDGRVVAVAVTRGHLRFAELGPAAPVAASLHQLGFALRRLSQPRSRFGTEAAFASARSELERLAETLVGPFADLLAGHDEVVVASPAALLSVPWGVLRPLADIPVRTVPSAMTWWHTSGRRPSSDRVVLVAGPGLAAAREEVTAIAPRYPDAECLVGAAATSTAVGRAAPGARLVHLACHGELRADSAGFSALRLADGPMTVHDLDALPGPAHHWVLAACDLGRPGKLAGGDLEGVLATLLFGGAGGVVAATVSVPDLPTGELMVGLHDALASGASLADAVRSARAHVDERDPAGFVTRVAFSCYGGG